MTEFETKYFGKIILKTKGNDGYALVEYNAIVGEMKSCFLTFSKKGDEINVEITYIISEELDDFVLFVEMDKELNITGFDFID
jgi:hypothetical protein